MSICIVRSSELCFDCSNLCQVQRNETGGILVAIEANDLCSHCVTENDAYIRMADYEEESALVRKVQRNSPWHRRLLWESLRQDLKRRWPLLLAVGLLSVLIGMILELRFGVL